MKTRFLFLLVSLMSSGLYAQLNDWENAEVFAVNKEAARSWFIPYSSEKMALSQEEDSDQIFLLNGNWKFHWSEKPSDRPVDFYKPDFKVDSWKEISDEEKIKEYDRCIFQNSRAKKISKKLSIRR